MTDRPTRTSGRNALWDDDQNADQNAGENAHGNAAEIGDEHAVAVGVKNGGGGGEKGAAASTRFKRLSREEAAVLRAQEPPVSPWRTIAVQMVTGVLAALIGWLITGRLEVMWSLLYGAATVVVPGALMARGMTSKLTSLAAGSSAVSFMLWEFVKIGVSVAMLIVAGKIVQPLVWPALLVGMVVCMKVYWVALLWRRRKA
ncbi:MAG: ATP synthase subunit I [Microbacteriaceae bacterium]|nr:ATP synthase subunit I [Burkholderiaceae bacterium]